MPVPRLRRSAQPFIALTIVLPSAAGEFGDRDARRAHRLDLVLGGALAAGDDGAGMAHAAARRRRAAGDEADHRLLRLAMP